MEARADLDETVGGKGHVGGWAAGVWGVCGTDVGGVWEVGKGVGVAGVCMGSGRGVVGGGVGGWQGCVWGS